MILALQGFITACDWQGTRQALTEVFGPENFLSVFQKQGEILILKKMLNFLSFLVLLYVSGHFKQKKISNFFSD